MIGGRHAAARRFGGRLCVLHCQYWHDHDYRAHCPAAAAAAGAPTRSWPPQRCGAGRIDGAYRAPELDLARRRDVGAALVCVSLRHDPRAGAAATPIARRQLHRERLLHHPRARLVGAPAVRGRARRTRGHAWGGGGVRAAIRRHQPRPRLLHGADPGASGAAARRGVAGSRRGDLLREVALDRHRRRRVAGHGAARQCRVAVCVRGVRHCPEPAAGTLAPARTQQRPRSSIRLSG